jgi:phytoene desaturase
MGSSSKKVLIIGAGFAGLSSACYLAQEGFDVTVVEKHSIVGGRARYMKDEGLLFDMGPSWYWLPDVFENFFSDFGKKVSDYYKLLRLDPSYRVFFGERDFLDIPADRNLLIKLFEDIEPDSGKNLEKFLKEAGYKYRVAVQNLVLKPGLSVLELFDLSLVPGLFTCDLFGSIRNHINKFVKNPRLQKILEFPVLFLGASPQNTPSLYSFMNYADMGLGTWYPLGGMHEVARGMESLARSLGVKFEFQTEIKSFEIEKNRIQKVYSDDKVFQADFILNSSDYHHCDTEILESKYSNYKEDRWDKFKMSPGSLIFYIGTNKKIESLIHHNLFFDEDLDLHSEEIYEKPKWPTKPLFYVSCTSKTDPDLAPPNHENIFILIPVASGIKDTQENREKYFNLVIERIEKITGEEIESHIIYKKSYAHANFIQDYHAYKGNAYGLANTLLQTHIFKPPVINKKIKNLFYAGQLTVPGPGVPPSIISGKVLAKLITKRS